MKIKETNEPDRFGIYPCCWVTGKDACPQNVQEWLFKHYQGYKFAVIFDCTKEEYETEKETPVYFLDELFDEIVEYIGVDDVKKRLDKY